MIERFSLEKVLKDPGELDTVSIETLDDLIREYPYASWLHILKAVKKKMLGTLTDADVHRAAMYAPDRNLLYQWLELDEPFIREFPGQEAIQHDRSSTDKLDIISGIKEMVPAEEYVTTDEPETGPEPVSKPEEVEIEAEADQIVTTAPGPEENPVHPEEEELEPEGSGSDELTEEPVAHEEDHPLIEGKVLRSLLKNGRIEERDDRPVDDVEEESEEVDQAHGDRAEMNLDEPGSEHTNEESEPDELAPESATDGDHSGQLIDINQRAEMAEEEHEDILLNPLETSKEESIEMSGQQEATDEEDEAWSFISWLAAHKPSDSPSAFKNTATPPPADPIRDEVIALPSEKEDQEEAEKEDVEEPIEKLEHAKGSKQKKESSPKKKKEKKRPLKKLIEKSIIQDQDIASEPLADLLARQGHTNQAIQMYERLRLIFPEKSAFFAQKIKKLKKK